MYTGVLPDAARNEQNMSYTVLDLATAAGGSATTVLVTGSGKTLATRGKLFSPSDFRLVSVRGTQ